jgi:signal transduction histidine kinase
MTWTPHLRTVLLLVNTLVLLLPLGGIAILRLYESELIRQTESELIAQGAIVAAAFREEAKQVLENRPKAFRESKQRATYGTPVAEKWLSPPNPDSPLDPLSPKLDLAMDNVRPPADEATPPGEPTDGIAETAAEAIQPILKAARRMTLAGIRIVDFHGTVVGSTGSEMGLSLRQREEVKRALIGERVSLLRKRHAILPTPPLESISRRTRVRVFVALPVILDDRLIGAVVLSRTPLDIMKALYLNRFYLIVGGIAIVAVVILVSVLTSRTISLPVSALIRQAELVTTGEKTAAVPLAKPGTYEVDRLSKALAAMSLMMEKRSDYIRTFASNVSHEFKTPLTSMRGTIELLRDHVDEMPRENRDRFLEMLEDDTGRMERLVRRLLDLARADVIRPGNERADVNEVLNRVVQRYRESGLQIDLQMDTEASTVRMAPETFESIVANFLDNARQHGGNNVKVTLITESTGTPDSPLVELHISDSGKGISDADMERIFNPFFTTARATGGTGLGLSIVQTLVTAHGGNVRAENNREGAGFVVQLPA